MDDKWVAIYIRVSTDAQREEGYSIDAQKEMLVAHCVSKGLKNYKFYIDGGYTGSNIDRPQLQCLISDVKKKLVSCVLVYKIDRLSRSQKDTLYLIEDVFNPCGVDFVSLNESLDTSTPLGRLMLGILSAFAQLERENIRERTRMGMKERVKTGLWMGGGRIPFGYDYDSNAGILVPNDDAKLVQQAYALYLDGYSCARIAQILGLKYERLVTQILMRKSNAGFICYNGEEYLGQHQPIIDIDTYERTMALMSERSVNRASYNNYLLSGIIFCGKCGARLRYQKWGKKGCKLICYSQDKWKTHMRQNADCDNARPWASAVEEVVLSDLFNFAIKHTSTPPPASKSLLNILEEQHDAQTKKLKRLYNLYSQSEDDVLRETIDEHKKQLQNLAKQLEQERESGAKQARLAKVVGELTTIHQTWEHMTKQEQIAVVRSVVEKIVITDDRIEIFYKYGL